MTDRSNYDAFVGVVCAASTRQAFLDWEDQRYNFTHGVGRAAQDLVRRLGPGDPIVYAVDLLDRSLLYVGQTSDAVRRSYDLPVGDSHHLPNHLPTEGWRRIVIVSWTHLLAAVPEQERLLAEERLRSEKAKEKDKVGSVGKALEAGLVRDLLPLVNLRRRDSRGTGVFAVRRPPTSSLTESLPVLIESVSQALAGLFADDEDGGRPGGGFVDVQALR